MRRHILALILLLSQIQGTVTKAYNIQMTTKEFLNFEVLNISLLNDAITIQGWAFLNENQHFRTTADHAIQLEFVSIEDHFTINASLTNLSMTSAYEQIGLPMCPDGVYFETSCNYAFEYVGFTASVPLAQYRLLSHYTTNLIFLAFNSQTYMKTPLYYPISTPLTTKIGDYEYSITSKLSDTQLRIIETPVYARKGPGKTATIWTSGTNCSMTYGNKLYYKFGSIFSNVISRVIQDNQTYYELGAKLDVCVDLRRRVIEGTTIAPVWIPGMFVEYSGSPLGIKSVLINSNPVIIAENQTIFLNQTINLLDYAKSYDLEEGDLTQNIIIESSELINKVGSYPVTYYVEDKYGYFDRKTINFTVVSPQNDPPTITASDKTIRQFSVYDPKSGVSAFDLQDGDLTESILVLNSIDPAIIGSHEQCFKVTDSFYASTIQCIIVTVVGDSTAEKFRFVSKNNLFFNQDVPNNWIGRINALLWLLNNQISIKSIQLISN